MLYWLRRIWIAELAGLKTAVSPGSPNWACTSAVVVGFSSKAAVAGKATGLIGAVAVYITFTVIVTEWPELAGIATEEVRLAMRHPLIIDGRNLLDPARVRAAGFAYEGIGRAVSALDVLPETPERELSK